MYSKSMDNKANKMRKTQIPSSTKTIPAAARRSHWQARINDLIEAFGSKKTLAQAAADASQSSDSITFYNRITAVQRQRMAVETAAQFVTSLEKLNTPSS